MLNDSFNLIPNDDANPAELRAACEKLAQRARAAELQRDEAEMMLRRIFYRHRNGLELVRGGEVDGLATIATRNANPLRAAQQPSQSEPSAIREGTAEVSLLRAQWLDYCRFGSCWTTIIELEFHHVMSDGEAPDDESMRSPFPSHATEVRIDGRSHCLLWLSSGAPCHGRWVDLEHAFRRLGDDVLIPNAEVRAWAVLPFPIADA